MNELIVVGVVTWIIGSVVYTTYRLVKYIFSKNSKGLQVSDEWKIKDY